MHINSLSDGTLYVSTDGYIIQLRMYYAKVLHNQSSLKYILYFCSSMNTVFLGPARANSILYIIRGGVRVYCITRSVRCFQHESESREPKAPETKTNVAS